MLSKKRNSGIKTLIDEVLSEMASVEDDGRYELLLERLAKLYKLNDSEGSRRVSPDTQAIVFGNLLGIAIIVGYERANVVASKAMSFVLKLR